MIARGREGLSDWACLLSPLLVGVPGMLAALCIFFKGFNFGSSPEFNLLLTWVGVVLLFAIAVVAMGERQNFRLNLLFSSFAVGMAIWMFIA